MERVWLILGSNLHEPLYQVRCAIKKLSNLPETNFIACSSYYRSRPLGPQNQSDFLNVVVILDTFLKPKSLLYYIQKIELSQGRIRNQLCRWGPRTLDLDILLFGNRIITSSYLTIPHYDIYNREFVLYPLFELKPNLKFPDGKYLINIINKISFNKLSYWK